MRLACGVFFACLLLAGCASIDTEDRLRLELARAFVSAIPDSVLGAGNVVAITPIQDDVDIPFGRMDLGLGIAGSMDDLDVVWPMVGPRQRSRNYERSTPDSIAVTQLSLKLVLEVGKALRIPENVFGRTGFDRNIAERILRT